MENRLSLTLDEFMALPQSESGSDIHCVTQWSRYDNRWKGVAAQALLAIVRPKPDARHVVFHSFDGYTTNVRLEQFDQPDVFLVHEWEGKPLVARAWRAGADADPAALFLEVGEVAAAHPVHYQRSPGLLGTARLSQQR